jgi:hypothetical protein
MSRFYGNMKGSRGETTRCGDASHGIAAHVRGWDIGVRATMSVVNGEDVAEVYITGGSNNPLPEVRLGAYAMREGAYVRIA